MRPADRSLPLLPAAAFVLVWSSGYIAGPYGVTGMTPLMLVALRFVVAFVVVAVLARLLRGPLRLGRDDLVRIALVGFVMNGLQFAMMYLAFDAGLGATLGALMHSLSPVLTVVLAGVLLGERLTRVQVLGFVVGVAGVLLVLGPDVEGAGGAVGVLLGAGSVLALSLGTLGQRWIGHAPDPLWSATIQFGAAAPPLLFLALAVEGTDVVRDGQVAVIAILQLALVNSIVGLVLLGVLARAAGAGTAASVFFLSPPVTAVLAYLFFGDVLNARELVGLVVAVVGVAVAVRAGQPRRPRSSARNGRSASSQSTPSS
jgi:drug/metabolite transporter (DMT)-like permease